MLDFAKFMGLEHIMFSSLVPSEPFMLGTSIQQDNRLSPYLFILCMEVVLTLVSHAIEQRLITRDELPIKHF